MNPAELLKKIASFSRKGMTQKQIAGELGLKPRLRERRVTQKQVLHDSRVMERRKDSNL